jgi:hypothetical protein
MIKLSSVASILFGIAWLVPSRADELADQPIAGADRGRELASAQPSTTKARPSRPQRAFVPMDFKSSPARPWTRRGTATSGIPWLRD